MKVHTMLIGSLSVCFKGDGRSFTGELIVSDISVPKELIDD